MSEVIKVVFNLPADELQALKELSAMRGVNVTHALRQAIATERFWAEQPDGSAMLIREPGGRVREVVFRDGQ